MAPKKNYTPEQMAQALALVQKGRPVATAAKRTGVPRITLMYKASGKSPRVCSMAPAGSLSLAEEDILVQNYHRKKEEKKLRMMEEKKKRSILREQNKLRKKYTKVEGAKKQVFNESGKNKKQKSLKKKKCNTLSESESDEEEWVPSESSSEGLDEFTDNELNEYLPEKDKHEKPLRQGDYVVVAFPCENNSSKNYMCVVQEIIDNTDAEVIGMICCNEKKTLFKLNENDVSVIKLSQIIKKMQFPKMSIAGDKLKYEFSEPADVENTLF